MELIVFITLVVLGYGFGRLAEARHYRSIREREQSYRDLLIFSLRSPPDPTRARTCALVTGSAVISVDYFKRILAGLRNLVGGPLTSYESLLDRARREAVLRMKEDARSRGASRIFNVKFETASISRGQGDTIGSIEVLAYGTALAD